MKNPIQPLLTDEHGVLRFKSNAIVRHLLDTHQTIGMNQLATMAFTDDDRQQFAQLIGYSLSGYGDLNYVSGLAYDTARTMADKTILNEDKARIVVLDAALAEAISAAKSASETLANVLDRHLAAFNG